MRKGTRTPTGLLQQAPQAAKKRSRSQPDLGKSGSAFLHRGCLLCNEAALSGICCTSLHMVANQVRQSIGPLSRGPRFESCRARSRVKSSHACPDLAVHSANARHAPRRRPRRDRVCHARRQRDLVDFEVMQQAGVRALAAQPLYRDDDGHFQYKYLPAYAFAMVPFGGIDLEISKALWFALSVGLLIVFVQQSVEALPGRRRSRRLLYWMTALVLTKFVVTELVNGQCNILLGVLAMAGFNAAQRGRRVRPVP